MQYFSIAIGAGLGGVLRYVVSTRLAIPFPWQTFVVNLLGGLLIGWLSPRLDAGQRLFWITGFCGGFTTFSTYSMETVTLLEQGRYGQAGAYVAASALLCVAAAGLAHWLSK
jgi:fluoride exporter